MSDISKHSVTDKDAKVREPENGNGRNGGNGHFKLERPIQEVINIISKISSGLYIYRYEPVDKLVLIFGNEASEAMTKIPVKDWLGKEFNVIWPRGKEHGLTDAFLKVAKTGIPATFDSVVYNDKRGRGTYKIYVFKISEDKIAVSFENVIGRVKAETALKESHERYKYLFENALVGLYRSRISDGSLIDCNQMFAKMFGYGNSEECIAEFTSKKHYADIAERKEMVRLIKKDRYIEDFEVRYYRKNGLLFWARLTGKLSSQKGFIEGVITDISDSKLKEEQLRKLSRAVEQSPNSVLILDENLKIEYINPRFTQLAGYRLHEVLHKNVLDLNSSINSKKTMNACRKSILEGKEWKGELWLKKKNGSSILESTTISPIRDHNGKISHFIKLAEDITKQKRAENTAKVLYDIAGAVNQTQNLADLFKSIHKSLGKIIDTKNFFIAIHNPGTNKINFPYSVDEKDTISSSIDYNDPNSLTAYVIRTGKHLFVNEDQIKKKFMKGRVKHLGTLCKIWLGVPLKHGKEINGAVCVQSYTDKNLYMKNDINLLKSVSNQIAMAIAYKESHERLRENEAKYRKLVENVKELIFSLKNNKFTHVNESMCRLFGYSVNELIGMALWDLTFASSAEKVKKEIDNKLSLNDFSPLEMVCQRKDGSSFVAEFNLNDTQKVHQYDFGTVSDITERVKTELALRRSEERYRSFIEQSTEGIWLKDYLFPIPVDLSVNEQIDMMFEHTIITECNDAMAQMYGMTHALEYRKWKSSEQNDRSKRENVEYLRYFIENSYKLSGYISEETDRNGNTKYFLNNAIGMVEEGFLRRTWGTQRDITEQVETQKKIKASEENYRTLVEKIQDGVFVIQDKKLIYSNETLASMIGYTTDEMIGKEFSDFIAPEDLKIIVKYYFSRLKSENVPKQYEFRLLHKDGETRVLANMTIGLAQYQGNVATLGTIKDITERKKLEEDIFKIKKLESLGILAGGIAHDFNNILMAVLGNFSLIKLEMDENSNSYKLLEDAEKASIRARELTQQLLTFSKGGTPVRETALILDLIKDSVRFTLRGTNVKPEFNIEKSLWNVEVDKGQLSQVINNIVINAQQAMPKGGQIKISAENVFVRISDNFPVDEGKYVRIVVQDFGIGIADENIKNIFDPYFTTKQQGSGLGLATSYSIIKNHDGFIDVESELGAGTSFTIYLPASSKPVCRQQKVELSDFKGSGKILVMDDEKLVRKVISGMLKHIGFQVEHAANGEEAIELYKRSLETNDKFACVIMDLTIPGGMGGEEAIKELKKIDPSIKAVVSSGYSNNKIMSAYKKYGFEGVVAKPFRIQRLRKVLQEVLSG